MDDAGVATPDLAVVVVVCEFAGLTAGLLAGLAAILVYDLDDPLTALDDHDLVRVPDRHHEAVLAEVLDVVHVEPVDAGRVRRDLVEGTRRPLPGNLAVLDDQQALAVHVDEGESAVREGVDCVRLAVGLRPDGEGVLLDDLEPVVGVEYPVPGSGTG